MITINVCAECHKEFEWRINQGFGKYCSVLCTNRAKARTSKTAVHGKTIIQLFEGGDTCEEIGHKLGIGGKSIKRYLVRQNVPQRTRSEVGRLVRKKHPSQFQLISYRGPKHPSWKGGKTKTQAGYTAVWNPDHPRADRKGYVFEHIVVWEEHHAKPLPKGWIIHHLNGVKTDNNPRNLIGMSHKRHCLVLAEKAKRIRALEIENELLREALNKHQAIFLVGDN